MDKQEELHKYQEFEPKMPDFDEIGWLVKRTVLVRLHFATTNY